MEKRKLNLKDASIAFLLAFAISQLAIIFGQLIIQSILAVTHFSTAEIVDFMHGSIGYMLTALFQCASFVGLFFYYYNKTTLKTECQFTKSKPLQIIFFVVIGIITMWSLNYFINYYTTTLNLAGKPSSTITYSLSSTKNYLISLISLAVLPAVGEELLFRGIIINSSKIKGKLFAVVFSSVLFTIFHFNLSQLFYPLLFGIVLGTAYIYTNNLIVPMIIHFVNNALNITLQYFTKAGMFSHSTANMVLMIVGTMIYLIILSVMLFLIYKKEKAEKEKQTDTNVLEAPKPATTTKTIQKASIRNFNFKFYKSEKFWFYFPLVIMTVLYIIITFFGA